MDETNVDEVGPDQDDDYFPPLVHLKYIAEGVGTLAEVAENLRAYADLLEEYASAGWELVEPVDGGYCYLKHPTEKQLPPLP